MEKIILFDIDETLISNNEYPENFVKIKELINDIQNTGTQVGVCTYRAFNKNLKKIIKDYQFKGPILTEGRSL